MNYSELNPSVNYGMQYGGDYEDTKSFFKYQEGLSNVNTKSGENYYCGGNASMAIRGMQYELTPLSELYFSHENIKRIQKRIKKEIRKQSKGQYKLEVDQDESDLILAMRAVFADNAKHLPNHIVRQVKELNEHTIDYIVPDMLTNLKQHSLYLKRLDQPIQTMDRPLNVNNGGRKTLPSYTSVWGF
jgi:hypothetical protein